MTRLWWLCCLLLATVSPPAAAQATDWPNRPVKVIVPFPPGSGADSVARVAAKQLEDALGQPFVIDNRGGANGAIGLAAAKASPADGYTIVLGSSGTMVINALFTKNLQYDPVKDFKPVHGLTRTYGLLVVGANSRWKSVRELIAAAKAAPGKISAGSYTSSYALLIAWFNAVTEVKVLDVPYKALGQALVDLLGGQLDFTIMDVTGATPLLQAGKIRALATLGATRSPGFPDVPTFAESGYPKYVNYLWNGFFVHADTPNDITTKLAAAVQKIQTTPAMVEYMKANGVEPLAYGPEAMRKYHLEDLATLRAVAEQAGIKPE